jgi:tRNA(fMet)-specific endonuclease VapC
MILLDTDHLTVLRFRTGERCIRLVARMESAAPEVFGTTIVNVAEQMKGWLAVINKEREAVRQVAGYRELARLFDFYAAYHIVPFDAAAAGRFDELDRADRADRAGSRQGLRPGAPTDPGVPN